jgi:hypothetical protein
MTNSGAVLNGAVITFDMTLAGDSTVVMFHRMQEITDGKQHRG